MAYEAPSQAIVKKEEACNKKVTMEREREK
jgi:hypothetical protein